MSKWCEQRRRQPPQSKFVELLMIHILFKTVKKLRPTRCGHQWHVCKRGEFKNYGRCGAEATNNNKTKKKSHLKIKSHENCSKRFYWSINFFFYRNETQEDVFLFLSQVVYHVYVVWRVPRAKLHMALNFQTLKTEGRHVPNKCTRRFACVKSWLKRWRLHSRG